MRDDITKVDFQNPMNHLGDNAITIGMVTKQCLQKLLSEGDISAIDHRKFYAGVRAFYIDATSQALKKLPFDDNTEWFLNVEGREECTSEFFCMIYSTLLQLMPVQMDRLQEFTEYQRSEVLDAIWKEALIYVNNTDTVTKQYCYMGLPVRH